MESHGGATFWTNRYLSSGRLALEVDLYFLNSDCGASLGATHAFVVDPRVDYRWLLSGGGATAWVPSSSILGPNTTSSILRTTGVCEQVNKTVSDGYNVQSFESRYPGVPSPFAVPGPLRIEVQR
ncbi:hypothetical protein NVS55_40110 (plasmid) [Myxococcus stipitatus]|uniref:hypothetical protein n=1 Tax=Myxococcus stipitatus TaxID=83455 RepID=UPI00314527E3